MYAHSIQETENIVNSITYSTNGNLFRFVVVKLGCLLCCNFCINAIHWKICQRLNCEIGGTGDGIRDRRRRMWYVKSAKQCSLLIQNYRLEQLCVRNNLLANASLLTHRRRRTNLLLIFQYLSDRLLVGGGCRGSLVFSH